MLYLMGESNVRTKVFDQAMYRQVYKSSVLKTKNSTIFQTIYYPITLHSCRLLTTISYFGFHLSMLFYTDNNAKSH